jgi:hypothetical protein
MSDEEYKEHITGDLGFGSQYVNIKASTIITLYEQFVVHTDDGPQVLNTKITADFDEIPQKYHEIFLNVMTAKYLNKVSFGNNPFSECKPIVRRKWWQFWKSKYFMQMQ